jgi:hypothetical protein
MIFLVAYAFGCEFWAPWSEEIGRWPVLQLSLLLVNRESLTKHISYACELICLSTCALQSRKSSAHWHLTMARSSSVASLAVYSLQAAP